MQEWWLRRQRWGWRRAGKGFRGGAEESAARGRSFDGAEGPLRPLPFCSEAVDVCIQWVGSRGTFWSCNSLSNKILSVQRLTADYTSPTTTHIGCQSCRAFEVKSLQCTFMVPGIRQRSGWCKFFPDCICGTFDLNISPRKWEKLIF